MQKITPFLWFDKGKARPAAELYTSVFPDSKIVSSQTMADTPSGAVEVVSVELSGQVFTLMGAGPEFKFSEAVSFVVECRDQEEVDHYWTALSLDPEAGQCGWTKDMFGLSWQIVPRRLTELLADPDRAKAARVTQAMLTMKKIIIADLEKAAM